MEARDHLQIIREAVKKKEPELRATQPELEQFSPNAKVDPTVTVDWIEEKLNGMATILETRGNRAGVLTQQIKSLLPQGLVVGHRLSDAGVLFQANGTARPFWKPSCPASIM